MTLAEATDLCRRCHRLAPFCNFNGNTFVAVIRRVIAGLTLPPDRAAALRSLAGHIVAGTATAEEQAAFDSVIDELSDLAGRPQTREASSDELAGHHRRVENALAPGKDAPPVEEHSRAGGAEHGLRRRTGELASPPRDTRAERTTRFVETARGVLSYAQLAPLLAERVLLIEDDIERGFYDDRLLDESLLLEFHGRIGGDLVPEWAGRWRKIEVQVGNLRPPASHQVAQHMRAYGLDLQARWPAAAAKTGDMTLELLAFAEGRFLTIHPFQDFNGRVIRLFLSELLRRLDLPPVPLAPEREESRTAYFLALEAADQNDFRPLTEIWKQRFAEPEPSSD
ncbi:MAG TPA: hypothetical protein DCE44_19070 [Verrucomicrobiales bacterium]|nr:hypothetical protein [Verrucomicrobiales bacterium]